MGLGIQHDVVQLGIVVRHAKGQHPRMPLRHQAACFLLPRPDECQLRPTFLHPAQTVLLHRIPQSRIMPERIVKVRNRLMKRRRGEIRQ